LHIETDRSIDTVQASVILNILKTLLKLIDKSELNINELSVLFDGILNPVAAKAQRKVALPNGYTV
jgi:hypothetical protein